MKVVDDLALENSQYLMYPLRYLLRLVAVLCLNRKYICTNFKICKNIQILPIKIDDISICCGISVLYMLTLAHLNRLFTHVLISHNSQND